MRYVSAISKTPFLCHNPITDAIASGKARVGTRTASPDLALPRASPNQTPSSGPEREMALLPVRNQQCRVEGEQNATPQRYPSATAIKLALYPFIPDV